jgi:4-amino-4-deoxy-L-arabinose transferase-like glycosyltransferase
VPVPADVAPVSGDTVEHSASAHGHATDPAGASAGRRFALGLVLLSLAGLTIRLAYVWFARRHMTLWGDPFFYSVGANDLAEGKGFIDPFGVFKGQAVQAADHPPLYLIYLAGFSLLGVKSMLGHLVASAVLGTASVVVAGFAGREIAGPRAGLLAATLVAVYPNTWRYDGTLLSETMVIFVVLLVIWAAYRYWHRPSMARLVVLGVAVGFAALARSELLLLLVLLVVPLGLRGRRRPWRQRLGWTSAAGAATLLVLLPWVAFNLSRFDQTVLLSNNLAGTLATANCDSVYYGPHIGQWDFECGIRVFQTANIDPSSSTAAAVLQRSAVTYIRDHQQRLPVVVGARLGRVTNLFHPSQQVDFDSNTEGSSRRVAEWGVLSFYAVAGLAVAGAVLLRRRGEVLLPLVAPVAAVLVTVALFFGSTRFRASAEGALCLLAAVALDAGLRAVRRVRATPPTRN